MTIQNHIADTETAQLEAAMRSSLANSIKIKNAMGPGADRDYVEGLIDKALQHSNKGHSWNAAAMAERIESVLHSMCLA